MYLQTVIAQQSTGDFPQLSVQQNVFDVSTDTALTSIYWFMAYRAGDFPMLTFTKDYFFVYSTDHDSGDGGINVGEGNNLDLSDFNELGEIISEYQSETPFLYLFPDNTRRVHLYYHTDSNDPANGGIQRTRLITTDAGSLHNSTWTQETNPLGTEAGDQHLGYLKFWDNGTQLKGVHYKKGIGLSGFEDGVTQYSAMASDGLSATRGATVDKYYNFFGSDRFALLDFGIFFYKYNQWWWVGNTVYGWEDRPYTGTDEDIGIRMVLCKANSDFELTEYLTELTGNGRVWEFYLEGTTLEAGDTLHCYETVRLIGMNYATLDLTTLQEYV